MLELHKLRLALVACALAIGTTACQDREPTNDIAGPTFDKVGGKSNDAANEEEDDPNAAYVQVEFLGNPLVSEVTILKANHDQYNRTQPYHSDEFRPQTRAFVNTFRPNQPNVANTLGAVLYPDMLIVESSRNPATSGWLSWALANGWGGRNLADDVVDAGLSAIFGTLLNAQGAFCANGQLPLCTDNVAAGPGAYSNDFPYLRKPFL
jgi:hypothetical protein